MLGEESILPAEPPTKIRVARLAKRMESEGLDGVIVAPGPNLLYYTGVSAQLLERPFLLFLTVEGTSHLLAPKFELGPFRESSLEVKAHGWDDSTGPSAAFGRLLKGIETKGNWGCEGRVPFGFIENLVKQGLKVRSADGALQSVRQVKDKVEIENIKKAAEILCDSYEELPGLLSPGVTERELSRALTAQALEDGLEKVEPMVQSGARTADPHAETSSRKIGRGEAIVVDTVGTYSGYTADITRTFVIGENEALEQAYEKVLAAQASALEASKEGTEVGVIDSAARGSLERDGLGRYFIHRTGHGLGLEVHEAPYITSGGKEKLADGMVFTVEPGAYLPGKFGVRIEDDVVVGEPDKVITGELRKEFGWWR